MYVAQPIEWTDHGVVMLDQRRLPSSEIHNTYTDYREVAKAIRDMVIRGAPAIGVAAAMGVALGVQHSAAKSLDELRPEFAEICDLLSKTRPTAVDLFWALDRMKARFTELAAQTSDLDTIRKALIAEARQIHLEKKTTDEAIGRFGAELMPREGQVMTQCNAGALATGGYRHRARRHSRRVRTGPQNSRAGPGNPPLSARRAPHRLGAAQERIPSRSSPTTWSAIS